MEKGRFYFKRFSVAHSRSSIKVGVDGVLIGAWCCCETSRRVFDVGTGCGLIALMVAQRNPLCTVLAVDIDAASVKEARENAAGCDWSNRITVSQCDFLTMDVPEGSLDLIVSNPPFFRSGVEEIASARMAARHQKSLPLEGLVSKSSQLLASGGRLSLILPVWFEEEMTLLCSGHDLYLLRRCYVRGHVEAPVKRVMMEFVKQEKPAGGVCGETLTLETSPGQPTERYRALCRDFYLRF